MTGNRSLPLMPVRSIEGDVADPRAASITGTRGFTPGKTTANVVEGKISLGAQGFGRFKAETERLLD